MSRHIDKTELISKLQTLEGLSNDERSSLIGLLREHKKYGLVWEDKPEDVEERLRDSLPVLREVKDKAIIAPSLGGGQGEAPNHILIEGDNLEALTALSYTHEGKIDVIYIDPPYNTGKEFIYNDNIVDGEDDYRHSKWLSFLNKRLIIAKKLLSDNGVIFISIDDNEYANLKLLCDMIFLEKNLVACFCVIRAEGGGLAKQVIKGHDYCLAYAKNISAFRPLGKPKDIRGKIIEKEGIQYWVQEDWLRKEFGKYGNCHYEELSLYKTEEQKKEIDEGLDTGKYVLIPKSNGMNIIGKLRRVDEDSSKFYSILKHLNKNGVNELKELSIPFDYPKPLSLIKELVSGASLFRRSSSILDFFAGSGTTLHATMQLNAEDGGHRQCILVTNNENNICEEVTYERNKRVINGYTTPKGVEVPGLKQNTLRYYKTDYISRDRTQKNMRDLVAAATDLLCIKEDLYEEQKTFGRFKLKPQLARYFDNGKRHMLIIYREELIDEIAEEIKKMDFGGKRLKIYVFSPGRYPFTDNFRKVEDKVELVALPAAIYDAYQKVLPKRKEKLFEEEQTQEATKIPSDLFEGE